MSYSASPFRYWLCFLFSVCYQLNLTSQKIVLRYLFSPCCCLWLGYKCVAYLYHFWGPINLIFQPETIIFPLAMIYVTQNMLGWDYFLKSLTSVETNTFCLSLSWPARFWASYMWCVFAADWDWTPRSWLTFLVALAASLLYAALKP